MQVKYSEKYCKHQLSEQEILEASQITVNVTWLSNDHAEWVSSPSGLSQSSA